MKHFTLRNSWFLSILIEAFHKATHFVLHDVPSGNTILPLEREGFIDASLQRTLHKTHTFTDSLTHSLTQTHTLTPAHSHTKQTNARLLVGSCVE